MIAGLFLLVQAASSIPSEAPPTDPAAFHLICHGTNAVEATHLNVGTVFAGRGAAGVVGTSTEHYQATEELDVEISGGTGKVRPPQRMVNSVWHPNGWIELVDVAVSPDEIAAKTQFSWASHPKLSIDRRTGSVFYKTLMGGFVGTCEPIDPNRHAF